MVVHCIRQMNDRSPNHRMFREGVVSTMVKAGPLAGTMVDLALSHVLLGGVEEVGFHAEIIGVENVPPPTLEGVVDEDGTVVVDRDDSDLKGIRLGIYWDHFKHTDPEVYEACL